MEEDNRIDVAEYMKKLKQQEIEYAEKELSLDNIKIDHHDNFMRIEFILDNGKIQLLTEDDIERIINKKFKNFTEIDIDIVFGRDKDGLPNPYKRTAYFITVGVDLNLKKKII